MERELIPGIYLMGQQTRTESIIKIGKAQKDISSRLNDYYTAAPLIEIFDTYPLPYNYVTRTEKQYHKLLADIGLLVPKTKEWFKVSDDVYEQLRKKGFKYFEMASTLPIKEIRLNRNGNYMIKKIVEILHAIMEPTCDFATLKRNDAINSRINQAIYHKAGRGQKLQLLADKIQQRCKTGVYTIPGHEKQNKNWYTGEDIADILDDPTFMITGFERQYIIKWVLEDNMDGVVIEDDIPMPILTQPEAPKAMIATVDLNAYRYNEENSVKQSKSNRLFLQQQLELITQYLKEYEENITFKT